MRLNIRYFLLMKLLNNFFLNRNRFLQCCGNPEFGFKFKFIYAKLFQWNMFVENSTHGAKKNCKNVLVSLF